MVRNHDQLLLKEINNPNLKRLPLLEQEIFKFRIIKGMNQRDIAKILRVTQGSISHRLNRICRRLSFLNILDKLKNRVKNIDQELEKYFDPFRVELLKTMLSTSCQTDTAMMLNSVFNLEGDKKMNQIKVRHAFFKCLEMMRVKGSVCYLMFKFLSDNLYLLHEVRLPQFYRGQP